MNAAPRILCGLLAIASARAAADDLEADPSSYRAVVPTLGPGDTLHLAPGTYPDLLEISGLQGAEAAPIAVTGPEAGPPAVFTADPGPCCNTVEIRDSSWIVLRHLVVDGGNVDGAFGVSAGGGAANLVHHVTVEDCTFVNHGGSQQHVAISTKTPTWGWVIRRNRILGAGTGIYLGNSDGTSPFVAGLVENNLVSDPIGYCMQIKWQQPRPDVAGMPAGPSVTIIRHNVFIKGDGPSPDGDRPNLMLGGFPDAGPGAEDRYEVYGNLFLHNPRESLLQASGRVSIHDNVFADVAGAAVDLRDHDLPLGLAHVYNNTIYGAGIGIRFGDAAREDDAVVGNLVFADTAAAGPIGDRRDDVTDSIANASLHVARPSRVPGEMDFYPLPGRCTGTPLDLSKMAADTGRDLDFNGTPKGAFEFRGAYAGDGTNPGWRLDDDLKPAPGGAGADADADGDDGADAVPDADGGADADRDDGAADARDAAGDGDAPGGGTDCACRSAGAPSGRPWPALAAVAAALLARRPRRRARRGRVS